MTVPLAVRYRPTQFSDMVGQHLTTLVLATMVSTGTVPSGLLFAGPSGSGKTTCARILAAGLCPNHESDLSVIEVDAASHGGVADVRALSESLRYASGSPWRVVILDEAQSLSRDAFNALLKTLEEPVAGVVFVLVTTQAHQIPETVKSRLMEFEFRRVTPADIFDRLLEVAGAEAIPASEALLSRIAADAGGSVRRALMDLDKAALAGLADLPGWLAAVSVPDAAPGVLAALVQGRTDVAYARVEEALARTGHPSVLVAQMTATLRDLLVLRSGGTLALAGSALSIRAALSAALEADRLLAAIKILWDLKTRVAPTDDPRGTLDLAVALIGEVFTRGRPPVAVVPTVTSTVVSTVAGPAATPTAPPAAPSAAPRGTPVPAPTTVALAAPAAPAASAPRRLSLADLTPPPSPTLPPSPPPQKEN